MDIISVLRNAHHEELEDKEKYCGLAAELNEEHPELGAILHDIANEERTHAKYIEYVLDELEK